MEGKGVLVLAALIGLTYGACSDGNCNSTEAERQIPVLHINLGALFPFLGPVDLNDERNHFANDAIDPRLPVRAENETSEEPSDEKVMSVNVFEMVISSRNDDDDMSDEQALDDRFPPLMMFGNNQEIVEQFETLDLSGKTLTGESLERTLKMRILLGQPVSSLILSHARVEGLTPHHLQPVQDTLRKLSLDHCTGNLDLLTNFSNLQFLNLSNNGLSTFPWLSKLTDTLEVLDLSHNQFVEVRPELSILTSLRKLDLSYNKIGSVKEFPLALLPNLEYLSLTMNSINEATFTELLSLQQLDIDWNYLRRVGYELQLPSHSISVKLASNPWRCDCGILQARDDNEVLDIDQLKCANNLQYSICEGCKRYFLPINDGRLVSNLTKDSIEHLGCTGITDQFYLLHGAIVQLREKEPEKLFAIGIVFLASSVLLLLAVMSLRASYLKKKFDPQSWLKDQEIPYLKIDKISKPREVPYVKM